MATSPEIKSETPIVERPEEFSQVPVEVENKSMPGAGVTPTPTQFKTQVTDSSGNPLIQTQQNKVVTINLPQNQTVLETEAKGSTEESKTWWAASFIRMVKRALHFGWQIIVGGTNGTA